MSEPSSVQEILNKAKEEENHYEWLKAADYYRKAVVVTGEGGFLRKGRILESLAYAVYKAAFQAERSDEFREKMHRAVEEYEKAKKCYEEGGNDRASRALRCDAMTAFARYWLVSDASEKKKSIDDCWRLTKSSLDAFKEAGEANEYGKTYNQLSLGAFLAGLFGPEYQSCKDLEEEAIEHGEQAIVLVSALEEPCELAKIYARTSIFLDCYGAGLPQGDAREKHCKKALDYWARAKDLCEEATLQETVSFLGANLGSEEDIAYWEGTVEFGKKQKDRFNMGCALTILAFHVSWKAYSTDDSDEAIRLFGTALQHASDARQQFFAIGFSSLALGSFWPDAPHLQYYWELADREANREKKRILLEKAITYAPECLKRATASGYPGAEQHVHHIFSKALASMAKKETDPNRRRSLLDEALNHRNEALKIVNLFDPFNGNALGINTNYLADIKSDMIDLAKDPEAKIRLLQETITSKQEAVKICTREWESWEKVGSVPNYAFLARYQYEYGNLLNHLNEVTGNREHLAEATNAFMEAAETFQKANLISRVAECQWKIAKAYDISGEHQKAADTFSLSSNNYSRAAEKIPQLQDFYRQHAVYMQAWSEIEKAKYHHKRQQYDSSEEHFRKASQLHDSMKKWTYLAPNYSAWAQLEHAEDLSRKDRFEEALTAFQEAAELFRSSKKPLEKELNNIDDVDEKQMVNSLISASDTREDYCKARTELEDARILDRKGDHYSSAQKYGSVVEALEKMTQKLQSKQDEKECQFIIRLSQAWQKMAQAEAEASPAIYLEASEFFEKAKDVSPTEKAKMSALGHSRFCRALEAGTRFADLRDSALHAAARQNLESAMNYYLKAEFHIAADCAKATGLLFDAYLYMNNAAKESDPEKKAKLYMMTERVLQTSASLYAKADNPAKSTQIRTLLKNVEEERELAVSLSEVLYAPIIGSTAAFRSPAPTHEQAVGLDRLEHAQVQVKVIAGRKEMRVGEVFDLEIELANAGKGTASLDKIAEAIPEGFEIIEKPQVCRLEGCNINMRGKRLGPLKIEEVRFSLKPLCEGSFTIGPRILYLDENGDHKVSETDPITLTVNEPIPESSESRRNLVDTGFTVLDRLLYGGIAANSAVILASASCDEKVSLIRSFLKTGVNRKQTTFHVTARTSGLTTLVEESQQGFHLFICNAQADAMIENKPNVFKLKGIENLTEINIALGSTLNRLATSSDDHRRICIDIVSDVLLQHQALNTRRWLNALIPQLKSKGFTILAAIDPEMHPSEDVHAILDIFDGELSIYEKETGKGSGRFLRILRMQEQEYSKNETPLSAH